MALDINNNSNLNTNSRNNNNSANNEKERNIEYSTLADLKQQNTQNSEIDEQQQHDYLVNNNPEEIDNRVESGNVSSSSPQLYDNILENNSTNPNSDNGGSTSNLVLSQSNSNQEAIKALIERTGYPIVQENGQRRYGPPPNWGSESEPDRGCEVFVGKIPRDCFEDEIVPLLERAGMVYEFRLMMEYSGFNRGYGFVMYTSRDDAKKAVKQLNNYEIRKGRMIGVCRSVDNCRLFVGGIPKNKKKEEILEEMRKVTEDVVNVIVYPSAHDKNKNRGFAFVQYTNHRAAAIARRKLIPNRIQLFGQPIAVDWAEPEPEVDEEVMATVKVLYVRNLMLTTAEETIKAEFEKIKEGSIERVKKMKDFAFVHFKERDDAINAMKIMNGSTIDGSIIEVSLSKPIDKNQYMRFTRGTPSPTNLLTTATDLNLLLGAKPLTNQLLTIPFQPVGITDPSQYQLQFAANMPATMGSLSQISSIQTNPPNFHSLTIAPNMAPSYIPTQMYPTEQLFNLQDQSQFQPIINSTVMRPTTASPSSSTSVTTPATPTNTGSQSTTTTLTSSVPPLSTTTSSKSRPLRVLSSTSRGVLQRSQHYNLFRGPASSLKKQASSQDISYDLYSGIKPVPLLPLNTGFKYENKLPTQRIIKDLGRDLFKRGLQTPIYTLHTINSTDQEGREIGLYMYKVTIPALFNGSQIFSNRFMRTIDEAKNDAAEFVISQLLYPQQILDQNDYYNQMKINQTAIPIQQQFIYNTDQPTGSVSQTQNQQQQNIISANNQQSTLTTTISNDFNQNTTQANLGAVNRQTIQTPLQSIPPEYLAAGLVPPHYILDPTGQYILCQTSGWQ